MSFPPTFAVPRHGRHVLSGLLLCGVAPALAGCGSAGDTKLNAAQVRFVEVSPGAGEMDFYINGTGAAYGVGYANFTSYLPVGPGLTGISVMRAGSGETLATAQGTLSGGHQYTAVVRDKSGTMQARLYQDQEAPAPAGQIALRVLNAMDDTFPLTVYVEATGNGGPTPPVTVLNLASGAASAYLDLPANGSYLVSATAAEMGLQVPVSSVTVKANAGAARSVVFAGTAQPGSHRAVGFALADVDLP